jgi:hypothetical protein
MVRSGMSSTSANGGRKAIRYLTCAVLTIGFLACAACSDRGSAQAGGSNNSGYGRVKVGVPF